MEQMNRGRGEIPEDDAEALYELSGGDTDKLAELRRTYLWTQEVWEGGDLDTLEKVRRSTEAWDRLQQEEPPRP